MNKKILVINSEKCEPGWFEIFKQLSEAKFDLSFCGSDNALLYFCRSKGWQCRKGIFFLAPHKGNIQALLYLLSRPLTFIFDFLQLGFWKYSKKIDTIVCFGMREKLMFSRWANMMDIKVIWIFSPGSRLQIPRLLKPSLALLSKSTSSICMTKTCEKKLLENFKIKNISQVSLGIKSKQHQEQKNIFDTLASNTSKYNSKKFFTIGTICDLEGDISHIEKLLHATKNCLRVIPHLQLIIAGEGEGRKNLDWMAKKMDIGNLVWFVGNHRHPQKWLSNFDIFITTSKEPKLKDLNILLLAAHLEKAVIAPKDIGLEEYIKNEKSGVLLDTENSQKFSDAIIDLQQNEEKKKRFAKNFHLDIAENFQMEKTINSLKEILER